MKTEKVSVVIPIYNVEATLKRCLDSVCGQTYTNLEILLIDDGSDDGSLEICQLYSKRDPRIVVHTQKNSGPSETRNRAIDLATGDYLAFVDADDYVELNMFERMVETAQEHAVDMVICSFFEEKKDSVRPHRFTNRGGYYDREECYALGISVINYDTATALPPYSWIRMVRRGIFVNSGLRFDTKIKRSEDFLLWVQMFFSINSMYLLADECLYHYVDNINSITRSYVPDYWQMCKLIFAELNRCLPKTKDVKKRIQAMLIQKSMSALVNASKTDRDQFEKDLQEVLNDKDLIRAARSVGLVKNSKRAKIYALLVILRLKFLIRFVFLKDKV